MRHSADVTITSLFGPTARCDVGGVVGLVDGNVSSPPRITPWSPVQRISSARLASINRPQGRRSIYRHNTA